MAVGYATPHRAPTPQTSSRHRQACYSLTCVRLALPGTGGAYHEAERGRAVERVCAAIIELGAEDDFAMMMGPGA